MFQLLVTDNQGATSSDQVAITINSGGASSSLPIAKAGNYTVVTLPTTTTTLDGSSSYDSNGSITSYAWTKVGSGQGTITSPSSAVTTITGLNSSGTTTIFKLTVTDNSGNTDVDYVIVDVIPNGGSRPQIEDKILAKAGPNV